MAHFAKVIDGVVVNVVVADQEFIDGLPDKDAWLETCLGCSGGVHSGEENPHPDRSNLRKNYAGAGYSYNVELDAFIMPQPYASWTLNVNTCDWEPPVPRPEGVYYWDEDVQEWKIA
jgi:hypothetical protein